MCELVSNNVWGSSEIFENLIVPVTEDHLLAVPEGVGKSWRRHFIIKLRMLEGHSAEFCKGTLTWIEPNNDMPSPFRELRPNTWYSKL